MSDVIAFIGGGNMATSLIGGLLAAGRPPHQLRACEVDTDRAAGLRTRFGIVVSAAAADVVAGAGTLVLAVKPQQMAEALRACAPKPGTTIVSIAAGVRLSALEAALGPAMHYVRAMPNTPALVGAGITGLFAKPGTPDDARNRAEAVLATAGPVVWLPQESDLDAVTALSGSGPAYVFLLVEAMREAGAALGLAPETAARLAAQTCVGAARMIAQAETDPRELRRQVTSKGGTTEAAVKVLEDGGLRTLFASALTAAARRSKELGDELDTPPRSPA
ncbi:MAG TPA: pyrroline-5-carboxylate reductase [Nevskiaceae bacterium]|nr:pyrroline-5-carboxylate reductase [Nevskiaceae bacterium]